MTKRSGIRVLLAVVALVGFALPGRAACPPGGCSAPGGGSETTDCWAEVDGIKLNDPPGKQHRVLCVDGDATCDTDGLANGSCTFQVTGCLNVADSRFPACAPANVTTYVVQNKPIGHPKRDPDLAALETAVGGLLPTSSSVCTSPVTINVPVRNSGGKLRRGRKKIRSTATTATSAFDRDGVTLLCDPATTHFARAAVVTSNSQLIAGPLARGTLGDYLLENDKIKVIIQKPGRVMFGIGTYGGNIIDADLNRAVPGRDNFEEWAPGINLENTANYTSVIVLNDGTNGQPAVVRATGPDDLLDFVNPSSVVQGFGATFPASADDTDLPVTIQTDYTLSGGNSYVRVDTKVINNSGTVLHIFMNDYLNGSGEVELFQPGYGFGEPLVTTACATSGYIPCTAGTCDPCGLVAYSGHGGADGVSYGYITPIAGGTTFSTSGVTVPILGQSAVFVLAGLVTTGNFTIPANGSTTVTRYFAIGDGSVASLETIRNTVIGATTGTVSGTVTTSSSAPVAGADVVAIRAKTCDGGSGTCVGTPKGPNCACNVNADCQSNNCNDRGTGTSSNVFDHFLTAADGTYTGTLPAGLWTLRANKDGRPVPSPDPVSVTVTANTTTTQNFLVTLPASLQVAVTDESNQPIPAKVELVGFDPSPDPFVTQNILGLINNSTGTFGEHVDDLSYGIALSEYADRTGSIGTKEMEPGTYQLVVSHGPRYSASMQTVTLTSGGTTSVPVRLARVIDTPGFVTGDFHVHSINSPDSGVPQATRVATMLAEGMDFFTPSDHDFRSDFAPTIASMGVGDLISTAQSAEITTFDYGHFNSWPQPRNPSLVNGGGIDWGRAGIAPGMDFPAYGSYDLTPAEIFTAAHQTPGALIQINHVASFFGADGLDIDTAEGGTGPAQSHTPGGTRRLDPSVPNYFDSGFDALEVWIGTDGRSGELSTFVGLNMGDWFNLLNAGVLRSGVADSDTHHAHTTEMNARNYIASAVTDPGLLGPEATNLAASIVSGHSIGTNAPFVTITTSAASTGDTGGLALGEPTLISTTDGSVDVTVQVKSPHWAPFDRVEFYVNNGPQAYDHDGKPSTRKRYRVIPDFVKNAGTDFTVNDVNDFEPAIPGARHYEATVTLNLTGLTQDVWIVALVRGTDGVSAPLFPVEPNSISSVTNPAPPACNPNCLANLTDGNVGELGMPAMAFTNPLYVDVDGGGWTPPGVHLTP